MGAAETRVDNQPLRGTGATGGGREPLAERVLTLVAMAGAAGGAVAGTVLGAGAGTAFPVACGTLGTMLGGGVAATGWCVLARVWTAVAALDGAGARTGTRGPRARSRAVTPAPSA